MTTKVVNVLKYIGLCSLVFLSLVSCEKEIESIGVNLVDNNNFNTNSVGYEVVTSNLNVDKVPSNNLQQYLLGVYKDNEFGKLSASVVTQLGLPAAGESYSYGTNTLIDSVIVSIPYQSTKIENYSDGKPQFEIDSVIGNQDIEFQLKVYELKTFLNTLDPNDPSKEMIYYSDKDFLKGDIPLYSGSFKVNRNDTVSYIKRYLANGTTVYDRDTIKQDNLSPTLKIPLDETMIKQLLVDTAGGDEFSSFDNFIQYFRGLYIEASTLVNEESHLVSLGMASSKLTIYYSIDEDEDEDEDLNGNEVDGEQGVRTKHAYDFLFGTLKSNVFERDETNMQQSGNDRLYVQGAAGSMTTIELFGNEDITDLRNKNWLINEANLIFYVDQNALSNIAPEKLLVYNFDEKLQLRDMITEGTVGGELERDDDGNPHRYVFKITDYISEFLKLDSSEELIKLGLKVHNPSDVPSNINDLSIEDFSWNPKGVVLYNHHSDAGDKRIKLEIFYTELNI